SSSGDVEQARFEAEAQVLVERIAQVCFALWLLQEFERAHLGAAFSAGADLHRAALLQLAVAWIAKPARNEERAGQSLDFHTQRRFISWRRRCEGARTCRVTQCCDARGRFELGLAAVAPWRSRAGRHVAETHAACLPPIGAQYTVEDAIGGMHGLHR